MFERTRWRRRRRRLPLRRERISGCGGASEGGTEAVGLAGCQWLDGFRAEREHHRVEGTARLRHLVTPPSTNEAHGEPPGQKDAKQDGETRKGQRNT